MTICKDCDNTIIKYQVRCPICKRKNTEKRKYKRQHKHRLKNIS